MKNLEEVLKQLEFGSCDGCGNCNYCVICGAPRQDEAGTGKHEPTCPVPSMIADLRKLRTQACGLLVEA